MRVIYQTLVKEGHGIKVHPDKTLRKKSKDKICASQVTFFSSGKALSLLKAGTGHVHCDVYYFSVTQSSVIQLALDFVTFHPWPEEARR